MAARLRPRRVEVLVARAGPIGGPGDHTGSCGPGWLAPPRERHAAVLVPDSPPAQVVDVRGLASRVPQAAGWAPPAHTTRWARSCRSGSGWRAPRLWAGPPGQWTRHPPREQLPGDVLAWGCEQGLDRPRHAGLSAQRERRLLANLPPRWGASPSRVS